MQPEARLIKKAKALIVQKGGRPFKIHGGDPMQETGIPDLLVCYKGRFVGLEGKTPRGRLAPKQRAILQEISEAGGYTAVFETLEQVSALLAKIDEEVDR